MSLPRFPDRVKEHRRVAACDLVPHPLNPRLHPELQREALTGVLEEVGLARSLLAYDDPEWGLTLIDGHLRQDVLGAQEVTVEVLDVTREEASKLLLSLDPLAALAAYNTENLDALRAVVETDNNTLADVWAQIGAAQEAVTAAVTEAAGKPPRPVTQAEESWAVVVVCTGEKHQREVLADCKSRGLKCRAIMS